MHRIGLGYHFALTAPCTWLHYLILERYPRFEYALRDM